MLTIQQISKIMYAAIYGDILILTANRDSAVKMYNDIMGYLNFRGLKGIISYSTSGHINFKGGYGNIAVMSVERWNSEAKYTFKGRVFVTNRKITDIKNIVTAPIPLTAILEKE